MDLSIGPRDDDDLDVLRATFEEHLGRFAPDDWASQMWPADGSAGIDTRRPDAEAGGAEAELIAEIESRPPGGREKGELERAVGLPGF
ncbi:MAG: hypothetical protein ABSG95_03220 [Solirubrobacteraceae bacterium]|jgi:hypothetical protein